MNTSKREAIRMLFGGKCSYCGCDLPEKGWQVDHVEPIYRMTKFITGKDGYRKLVPTGECHFPERDHDGNLFPCCRSCNIHKGPFALETWRTNLQDLVGVLRRNYPTYRHAERFGQVQPNEGPIVFWFEQFLAGARASNESE